MMAKGSWWPIGLGGVLALTVAANGWLLYQATRNGGTPIERNYYRKAVAWDSTMAQSAENRELGWQVGATLDTTGALSVELLDRAGNPMPDAAVSVEGFAVAFVDGDFAATLSAGPDRRYGARVALKHGGLHEIRVRIIRHGKRFTAVLRGAPGGAWTIVG